MELNYLINTSQLLYTYDAYIMCKYILLQFNSSPKLCSSNPSNLRVKSAMYGLNQP